MCERDVNALKCPLKKNSTLQRMLSAVPSDRVTSTSLFQWKRAYLLISTLASGAVREGLEEVRTRGCGEH